MTQKYQFVAAHASEYLVTVLCRVLGLARSGYYAWRKRPLSVRVQQDQQLTADVQRIFTDSHQTYGSPRVPAELRKATPCARKRVARLMRQAKLIARPRRRTIRTTDSRHTEPVAPICWGEPLMHQRPIEFGSRTSPTWRPRKAGCTWQ